MGNKSINAFSLWYYKNFAVFSGFAYLTDLATQA